MSLKTPPTTMHLHGNMGMQVDANEKLGHGVGISGDVNSPTKHAGVGVGISLRPF